MMKMWDIATSYQGERASSELWIKYHPKKQQSVIFTKISYISRRNCKRVHIRVYEYQLKWTCILMVYKKSVFQFRNSRPGPYYQHSISWIRIRVLFFSFKIYFHTLNPVCSFNQYHKKIFNFYIELFIINEFI